MRDFTIDLPNNVGAVLTLPNGSVRLTVERGCLKIMGLGLGSRIKVLPEVSNVVRVGLE